MDVGLSFSIFGKRTCVMGGSAVVPQERHFAQCAENGIERVELTIMEGYIPPGDMPLVRHIRRAADTHRITFHSVHGPSGWPTNGHWLGDPDEDARRRNVEERCLAIEGAACLGARSPCDCMNLEVLNRENPRITPELVRAYERIKMLIPAARRSLPDEPTTSIPRRRVNEAKTWHCHWKACQ